MVMSGLASMYQTFDWSLSSGPSCLGKISKRGNRYLCVLFVQAAWVVLIKPMSWDRHGLKRWIEAAKKRLHRNVLAIALADKLARIAWGVLAGGRTCEPIAINLCRR
jgi:transposase